MDYFVILLVWVRVEIENKENNLKYKQRIEKLSIHRNRHQKVHKQVQVFPCDVYKLCFSFVCVCVFHHHKASYVDLLNYLNTKKYFCFFRIFTYSWEQKMESKKKSFKSGLSLFLFPFVLYDCIFSWMSYVGPGA